MTGPRAAAWLAARITGAAALLACSVLLSAPSASACVVSIGYKPSLDIAGPGRHHSCSTGTSLAGAGGVAVLVLGALGVAGRRACRRGEEAMGSDQALTVYLEAAGVVPPEKPQGPREPQGGDRHARP
ncbi:hypothetical protein [Streptomyces sp. NRRL F-2747]|uniref:hypothetical protein n=1 Tax=Streptomyces sp. NRRL F-2747 TaxID=1463843 RepID=UPI0004C9E3F2|nr:hypothetical protein [Streptomyces sp. NRRL F-2747]